LALADQNFSQLKVIFASNHPVFRVHGKP